MNKLHLSESLFANITLTEDFSASMPDWLRGHILTSIVDNAPQQVNKARLRRKYRKSYNIDQLRGREQKGRDIKGNPNISDQVWAGMDEAGIDFANAQFIKGDIPTKGTDPRMKAPNQAFMLIEYNGNKQVYAPGLNNQDVTIFPLSDQKAPSSTFKYAKFSDYKDYITDFYYVNTADPNNLNTALRDKRTAYGQELADAVRAGEEPLKQSPFAASIISYRKDKSGYIIPHGKFTDKLRQAKKNNYANYIENLYNRLIAVKNSVGHFISSGNLDYTTKDVLRDALEGLHECTKYYNDIIQSVATIEAFPVGSEEFNHELDVLFDSHSQLEALQRELQKLEETTASIRFTDFDW